MSERRPRRRSRRALHRCRRSRRSAAARSPRTEARLTVSRRPRSRNQRSADAPRETSEEREEETCQREPLRRQQAVEVEVHPGHDEVDRERGTRSRSPRASSARSLLRASRARARPRGRPRMPRGRTRSPRRPRRRRAPRAGTSMPGPPTCPVVCTVSWRTRRSRGGPSPHRDTGRAQRRSQPKTSSRITSVERAVDARQEDRDEDDRPELAGDAGAEHGATERRGQAGPRRRGSERACRAPSSLRATASSHHSASTPGLLEERSRRRGRSRTRSPSRWSRAARARRGTRCSITSRPAKKKSIARPKLREERDVRS